MRERRKVIFDLGETNYAQFDLAVLNSRRTNHHCVVDFETMLAEEQQPILLHRRRTSRVSFSTNNPSTVIRIVTVTTDPLAVDGCLKEQGERQ
jgi:hypothetical protein